MIQAGKYKVSNLAKDLNMKTKEVTDLLASCGFTGKTHSSVLTEDEFAAVISKVTDKAQVVGINDYIDSKAFLPTEYVSKYAKTEENAEATSPKAEKTDKAQKPAEVKTNKPSNEQQFAPKQDVKAEKEAPKKAEVKPQPKVEAKVEIKAEAKVEAKVEPKVEAKVEVKPAQNQEKPAKKENAEVKKPIQQQQPKKQDTNRFANVNPLATQNKNEPKKDVKNTKDRQSSQLLQTSTKKEEKSGLTVQAASSNIAGTKLVDTRSSNVDLSKYDEKLENFDVDNSLKNDNQRKKLKKQPGKQQREEQATNKPQAGYQAAKKNKNKDNNNKRPVEKQQLTVSIPDEISVGELASRLKVAAAAVIKQMFMLGSMATVNQFIDFDTAEYVATELGAKVVHEKTVTIEEKLFDDTEDKEEELVERAPVVCVMGHVDHGKTSILDRIRNANVTAGEAGGITQHIGAYRVTVDGRDITFLDTPGHEAFTAMRARGAMATDIAILVVAADDGIMPQTVEAINHAKAAGIDIIVAINKMDKPTANPDNVKQGLTVHGIVPEEWGGDAICVPVSALTGFGFEDLLENVLLVAEIKGLKANPNRRAKGIVIEARLDKGRGPVATVLVQSGTLHAGDTVIAGNSVGRVRAMTDDKGRTIKSAGPSVPVEIIGLAEVPSAGDEFNAVADERMARELAEQRRQQKQQEEFNKSALGGQVSLDALFAHINEGAQSLNIIVKADVGGSAEAVKASLVKLSNEDVKVNVIHSAVGGITESDVLLATASNAIIVGFNVRPDKNAIDSAKKDGVDIRTYRVIYECIEEIEAAMKGMLAPTFKEELLGHAQVRQTIRVPGVGVIAGSYIQDGKISRNAQIRVVRDGIVIAEDKISSLKRFKDDVKEVATGYECGIGLEKFNDIKENDVLEAFMMVEVKN